MRAGQLIAGRYRLEEQIGAGGMGVVWRAVDEKTSRVVALKRAVSTATDDSERMHRRMRREARIAAKLRHPHVVAFIDEVVEGRERWLVMEYVPAQSLAQILDRAGPLLPRQVTHIGAQIASALEAVHAEGVVHRDIKPGNILITEDGTVKLTDFGISRPIYGDVTMTDNGVISGTVAFLASEVADGQEATPASDVFALGATLFAAVEGMPPFGTADNPLLVLRRAAAGDLLPVRRAGPLTPVLSALLQPDPAKRPDATAARQMLEELAPTSIDGAGPGGSCWPVGSSGRPRRARRRAAVVAVAACAATLAIAAGIVVSRPDGPPLASPPLATPRSEISDGRSADPCALTNTTVLAQFGKTIRESARGNFNRCDVVVQSSSGSQVDVKVQLEPTAGVPVDEPGRVKITPQPETRNSCLRIVQRNGQDQVTTKVTIDAKMASGPTSADLCAMADATATHAVTVLSRGAIPPRGNTFHPASLALVNACELLDPGTLRPVLGDSVLSPKIGFGEWKCRWQSTTSALSVDVAFERDSVNKQPEGRATRIGERDARVRPRSDGLECDVLVAHRDDVDDAGKPVKEKLLIKVSGPQPSDQLCGPAETLAAAAATQLPPLR